MKKSSRRSAPRLIQQSYQLRIHLPGQDGAGRNAGRDMAVEVTHKDMKTLRLRVLPTGEIRLSVPRRCDREAIDAFLQAQTGWIAGRLADYERRYPEAERFSLRDGGRVRVLGVDRPVRVERGDAGFKPSVGPRPSVGPSFQLSPGGLLIRLAAPLDGEKIAAAFEKWWRTQAMACYRDAMARMLPVARGGLAHGQDIPAATLHIRRMRSRWGSCSYTRGRINLNLHLYQAPQECVDYVMLHELAHFLHHRHDKAFYSFMAQRMPDYRAREKRLDQELIPGGNWPALFS